MWERRAASRLYANRFFLHFILMPFSQAAACLIVPVVIYQNPTNDCVAAKICELEGGVAAMLTSSGQAANYYASSGLQSPGYLSGYAVQSKLPESTMAPPTVMACPSTCGTFFHRVWRNLQSPYRHNEKNGNRVYRGQSDSAAWCKNNRSPLSQTAFPSARRFHI